MSLLTDIADTFRDFETMGLPASGGHEPKKSDIRALLARVVATIANGGAELPAGIAADLATVVSQLETLAASVTTVQDARAVVVAAQSSILAIVGMAGLDWKLTKAAAVAVVGAMAAGAAIGVLADESRTGGRSIYIKTGGVLVWSIDLPTDASAKTALEASGARISGDVTLATTFPTGSTALLAYGDSITAGWVGATQTPANAYAAKVATRRARTVTNYGMGGAAIIDVTFPMLGQDATAAHPVLNGDESWYLAGYNDQRFNGGNADYRTWFGKALLAAAVWRSIPDTRKLLADNSAVTLNGTWAATPVRSAHGRYSTTSGGYAQAVVDGTTAYIVVLLLATGAIVQPSVDGVNWGPPINLNQSPPNGGAISWAGRGVLTFQSYCIRLSGLGRGKHTIRLTNTNGGFMGVDAIMGNGSLSRASARFYIGNALRSNAAGATGPSPYVNYTDTVNRAYCQVIEDVVRQCQDDNLDVHLWDANSAWDPDRDPSSDNIHPEEPQHVDIAASLVRVMSITTAGPVPGPREGLWRPVIQGLTTAGTNTYSVQEGSFRVDGNVCTARGRIKLATVDAAMDGPTAITLPVLAAEITAGALGRVELVTLTATYNGLYLESADGQAVAVLRQWKSGAAYLDVPDSALAANTDITFSISYRVNP